MADSNTPSGQSVVPLIAFWIACGLAVGVAATGCGPTAGGKAALREVKPPTGAEIEAGRLLLDARRQVESGSDARAEAALRRVIELTPSSGEAHHLLGRALYDQGRRDEARAALREAVRLDPGRVAARGLLARTFEDAGDMAGAAGVYRAWTEHDPDSDDAYFELGRALHELGEHEASRDAFKRAIRNRATRSDARSELGLVLHEMGSLEQAEARQREAIEREPESITAWSRLGAVLDDAGADRRADALEAYGRALALGDTRAVTRVRAFRLERLRAREGEGDAAARAANLLDLLLVAAEAEQMPWHGLPERPRVPKAPLREEQQLTARIRSDPTDLDARLELARLLQAQGLADEAIKAYGAALESAPAERAREIGARLGGALLAVGRSADAEPLLSNAPESDAVAIRQLAWLHLQARRAPEALAGFERVLALNPDDLRAKRGRALACLALDRLDDGLAAFATPPRRK